MPSRAADQIVKFQFYNVILNDGSAATGTFDYDFTTSKQSSYVYATIFYPLWAGLATKEQAAAVDSHLPVLDRPGPLRVSRG